jgi:hypothetical protein
MRLSTSILFLGVASVAQAQVMLEREQFRYLKEMAENIISPEALEIAKNPSAFSADLSIFDETNPYRRRLNANEEECGIFLAASLSPALWECYDMASSVLGLVTEKDCTTQYDFSNTKMAKICNNACYEIMVKTLKTMSAAGCSASILRQSCNKCSSSQKCVDGKCRTVCASDAQCTCDDQCTAGACIPPKSKEVQLANLGVNGYRVALEYLCTKNPVNQDYCFSKIFGVLSNVDASTFCTQIKPIGCCTGTVFGFVTECATGNDTIQTSVGPISLADLESYCGSTVDFITKCATAPDLPTGACMEGYFLSPASPSARASFLVTLLAGAFALAALAFN